MSTDNKSKKQGLEGLPWRTALIKHLQSQYAYEHMCLYEKIYTYLSFCRKKSILYKTLEPSTCLFIVALRIINLTRSELKIMLKLHLCMKCCIIQLTLLWSKARAFKSLKLLMHVRRDGGFLKTVYLALTSKGPCKIVNLCSRSADET